MNLFERWLTLWVALCIVAGIALGQVFPAPVQALGLGRAIQVVQALGIGLGQRQRKGAVNRTRPENPVARQPGKPHANHLFPGSIEHARP